MVFSSFAFILLFLPLTLSGYFLIGKRNIRASNIWLLAASFFFYGWWDWRFVPLLLASIVWNYICGTKLPAARRKKVLLFIAIAVNIALLGYFKYTNFFIHVVEILTVASDATWNPNAVILPLGISFWTFTQTAFLIDAYRGRNEKCSFWDYSLFVMIFPHLISGPIINHAVMIPQFNDAERHKINWDHLAQGIALFVFGLFKKAVIADSLSTTVALVFEAPNTVPMLDTWIGILAYTFQLYFDFSGYSDMAVGLGVMLNIDFPVNFDSPYKSSSPIEFWKRWHITLGAWIKDYLYIPLGGNRKGQFRKMVNLFICMTLCGFWHGAGFTFIAWGMYHGILLVVNHTWRALTKKHPLRIPKAVCVLLTFMCVVFGWVVFRADSIPKLMQIIHGMFNPELTGSRNSYSIRTCFTLIVLLPVVFLAPNAMQLWKDKFRLSKPWAFVLAAVSIACCLCVSRNAPFLYFSF